MRPKLGEAFLVFLLMQFAAFFISFVLSFMFKAEELGKRATLEPKSDSSRDGTEETQE